jgi:mannose-1-phosphate guanylyltransferase/mannose-1-phosphate guanylyltransferase/mannose-6-phosphate isomerase|tara:strand:+ start:64 stop:414 length:351 start_codon:yes stop_codon:yes gene_type:complete
MELKNRSHEDRPWGEFDRFTLNEQTSVKILTLKPNQALSLQYHNNRDEFNRVLKGNATILLDDEERGVSEGDEWWTLRKMKHRIMTGDQEFQWLEISFGEFDENDIVRLEDKYNRK